MKRQTDRYRNALVAILDPPPEDYESGQERITIPEHGPETYGLDGYRPLDGDEADPLSAAIAQARETLNKRIKRKHPYRGYAPGRHFVLVVERRSERDPIIWSYSTTNGAW